MRLMIVLGACILGLLGAVGFYLALAPDETTEEIAPIQADYGDVFPDLRKGQRLYPTPIPTLIPAATATPVPTPAPTPVPEPTPVETPPPAPAPVVTPVPTPQPEIVSDTKEGLIALVHGTFPDDPRMGGHVVWNESLKFDEGVWQGYVYGGRWSATRDCGLMQINWDYHGDKFAAHGWTSADCFIPERNLIIAREIYEGAGCSAWSTC